MAQSGVIFDRERLTCAICLDLLKDPVTTPCGHNYCMNCINLHWDGEDQKNTYSCPQCRQIFTPRPHLMKNTMLAGLVEEVKKTGGQSAAEDIYFTGRGHVSCDFCIETKRNAVKSCLQCLVSYCDQHLQPHYQSPAFKNHNLVDPSKKLQDNICSHHKEVMKIFCRFCQKCICYLCSLGEHRGHDTVPASEERTERQTALQVVCEKIQQRKQDRETDMETLQQEVEAINQSADTAVKDTDKIFNQLICFINSMNFNVKQQIKSQQETAINRAKDHHKEVMKIFCRSDQKCICFLCTLGKHRGHYTVPASAERSEKQTALHAVFEKIQQRIQNREKDVEVLQQEVEAINQSADKAVRNIDRFSKDVIHLIKEKSWEVKQQIRSQQETEVNRAKDLTENLQEEITELERKGAELEQLCNTKDDCQFLQMFPRISGHSTIKCPLPTPCHLQFEDVTAAVSQLKDKLQRILCEELPKFSQTVSDVDVSLPRPEPMTEHQPTEAMTRAELLQHSYQITLDPNTANAHMLLSEGNRKASYTSKKQSYSSHRDRFTTKSQVLSREALTGRHYWEVEWSGSGIIVAVAYKDISRKGDNSEFGNNDKSWAFRCSPKKYKFSHNSVFNPISGPLSSKVGVYLDHRAGILSFYSVSDTMTLLHKVQTTFSQPLHVGLQAHYFFGSESSAVFCELK